MTACGATANNADVELPDVSAMIAEAEANANSNQSDTNAEASISSSPVELIPLEDANTWYKVLATASISDKSVLNEDGLKITCKGWQQDTLNEKSYVAACELEISNNNIENKHAIISFSECMYINGLYFTVRPENKWISLASGESTNLNLYVIDPSSYETILKCYDVDCNAIPLETVEFVFSVIMGEYIDLNEISEDNPLIKDYYISVKTDKYRPSDLTNLYGDKLYIKDIDENPIAIYAKRCGDGVTATLVNTSDNPVFLSGGIKDEARTTWSVNGKASVLGDNSINNMHHGSTFDDIEALYPGGSLVFNFTENARDIHRMYEVPDNEALGIALEFAIYIARYHDADSLGLVTIPIANIIGIDGNEVFTYVLDDSLSAEDELL